MATANDFSTRRLDNLKRNQALLAGLGLVAQPETNSRSRPSITESPGDPAVKRRRVEKTKVITLPSRTSARLASAPVRPVVDKDGVDNDAVAKTGARRAKKATKGRAAGALINEQDEKFNAEHTRLDTEPGDLQASWSSWICAAPPPDRDEVGMFHFTSHPDFNPNKSPSEVIREGAFGGSYFRPLYSKKLRATIFNDYLQLPASWFQELNVSQYLISPTYDPEANKFKVMCGQSIEQWEENGWINHQHDVRGWFQWYCRFFMGRRCDDDERQVSRWKNCVGPTGRWRRMLLKKYMTLGVREVWDDGADENAPEVSPVIHQTCHHWAFEVTQDVLNEYWETGR